MKKTIALLSIFWTFYSVSSAQNPLAVPPTLEGTEINLALQAGQTEFYAGFMTNTIGYNQALLGPTLILEKGQEVTLNVTNNLSESTTTHWHGLHVAAKNDGGPHNIIEAGQTWSPSFTVLDDAATYWYHPHLHEHTEEQVTKGAAGFIIVRDAEEAELDLPRSYGVDDFPLAIQSKAFGNNKQLQWNTAADDAVLSNGTLDAYLDAPAQVIRLRLLNASTERVYNLGLRNQLNFYQIAADGGLLNAPVSLTRLKLAPGERAEILLDLTNLEGESLQLVSFGAELPRGTYGAANPSAMGGGSIAGYSDNELNGNDFEVLQINVGTPTSTALTTIPSILGNNEPLLEAFADVTRELVFHPQRMGMNGMLNGPFEINGEIFDAEVINFTIPLNNTEVWELTNRTAIAHPFHLHDVQFYILEIDGNPPPAHLRGKKDVVLVPPMSSARFITQFTDFADAYMPYMYHCHMLSHEDDGMMGQFIVTDDTTNTDTWIEDNGLVYPNPTNGLVYLTGLPASTIELYNLTGQLLERRRTSSEEEEFDLTGFAAGVYYFNVSNSQESHTYKVVKH